MPGNTKQIAMQRAASLMLLPPLLAELGTSLDPVLAGTGVSPSQLRPDSFIPYASYLAILDNAARVTGRDDLGLLLGRRQTLGALGPLGAIMRHAATLGEALADFTRLQINNSTGGAVYLMRADRDILLGYGVYDSSDQNSAQLHDMVIAVGCNLMSELTRGAVNPEEIFLSRSPPKDLSTHQRLGRCPIRFQQAHTAIVLKASTLAFPLPEADNVLHEQAIARFAAEPESAQGKLGAHVRHLLRPLLLMGQGRMEDVAARLALHPRALRRRLRQEGTDFETIKDEVRYAAARELLKIGGLSVADIALTLNYGSASSFVHAFRRWSGGSPGLWRSHAQ